MGAFSFRLMVGYKPVWPTQSYRIVKRFGGTGVGARVGSSHTEAEVRYDWRCRGKATGIQT